MIKPLKTIAVDLTPVLPGGENGGAKIFVLELLRELAEKAPTTEFVLLTQASAHAELAVLDRPNMRRLQVVGPASEAVLKPFLQRVASRLLPMLPRRMGAIFSHVGYRFNTALKRGISGSILRTVGADLLFCPFTAPTYFEPGIPTVCTVYDLQYKSYPDFFPPEVVSQRDRTFVDACRRATALAAISDYSRDSAIFHGKIDPTHIRTIHLHMARRFDCATDTPHRILKDLELSPQRYLIYPANFWMHKNHEMLITAFGMACNAGLAADIKLVCTGAPGERQNWLREAVDRLNLRGRVLFPGYVSNAELESLLKQSAGMIFPSLYEGFGLPVIEAMAAGIPVACSNTTSLPEVAADAAILFDPRIPSQISGAIISLLDDEVLRASLTRAGYQRAIEFSDPMRMANEYWDLFQYALENERYEDLLTGVYADGWAGPAIHIQVAPATNERTLEIEFFAPEWLPQPNLTIQTRNAGVVQGETVNLSRGASAQWSMPLEPRGARLELRIGPIFVPATAGIGEDYRELSAMLRYCSVTRAGGDRIELFAERVPG